ncbi:DUF1858 domain-containing protein [Ruficoccus amylovorans]|uniref:DUF1858 domain-containing protein n=1 Tax=Ruficoccus amylovorans TaxID=1804625 RepID=A0A842HG18_9BACT|nr:DUF1858 domain-containing protein [Ruficoccus amylovorans]MBC2594978.1 DUF1858 domain-containing protein [Ruficoccus amylovorans]
MNALNSINSETSLPELFRALPEARTVFNRYGLRGCGGAHGPAESLGLFASAHGVALDELIAQIRRLADNQQARREAREQLRADAAPRLADAIYRPFFLAAMTVVLTAGAAWGVLLLWKIGLGGSFTGVSVHEVNAHGHAQIMGWVGLFIMGFAYQAFPRMWQVELPAPGLAVVAWLATLAGITMRSTAMMFADSGWALPVHQAGGVLEILAVSAFGAQMLCAFRRSEESFKPYVGFIFAALACFLTQAVYGTWHIDQLLRADNRPDLLAQIATFQAPLRDLQVQGVAMLMIFGVGLRMFPAIFGLPEIPARRSWAALGILLVALGLEMGLFLAYRLTGNHALAAALLLPWLLLPIGAGLIVVPWRLWRPLPVGSERSAKFVRVAFLWLFISFAMLLFLPVYRMVSGIEFSHAYYGAIRHAITVGFISLTIVGMAAKVVPTLCGIEPEKLPRLYWPFILINLGCLFRVVAQIGTDWDPAFFKVIGFSGMLEWTGLAIWAGHLVRVMLGRGRYRQSAEPDWGPAPERIGPDDKVAAALSWFPELEEVFVAHGFGLVKRPVLRRTVARQVSIRQGCRMKGVDPETFLRALNRAVEHRGCSDCCSEH